MRGLIWACGIMSSIANLIQNTIEALNPFFIWAASWQNQQNGMCIQQRLKISLGICPVLTESSLSIWRKLGSLATHWVRSKDSDQTGRMPRLIWVFAGRTVIMLVLSCCGSFDHLEYLHLPHLLMQNTIGELTLSLYIEKIHSRFFKHTFEKKIGKSECINRSFSVSRKIILQRNEVY